MVCECEEHWAALGPLLCPGPWSSSQYTHLNKKTDNKYAHVRTGTTNIPTCMNTARYMICHRLSVT